MQIIIINNLDDQTLKKGAGIYCDRYKVILGLKSFHPSVRPEDAAPVTILSSLQCGLHTCFLYDYKNEYLKEDYLKISSFIWNVRGKSE